GWGTGIPLFDAGVENLREITAIENNTIVLGKALRGSGFPEQNERVVFWNKNPSGYTNHSVLPIITTEIWPEFAGKSIHFSSVTYDSLLQKWVLIANECDTNQVQIYAATSNNLVNWEAANNGNPILQASDFKDIWWAGNDKSNTTKQTPFTTDMIRHGSTWFLFLDGYSEDGKQHIGIATSNNTILGPWKIQKDPIISPGSSGAWNEKGCFYGKVCRSNTEFIMVYDGKNSNLEEQIGIATSHDLRTWKESSHNPITIHTS